MNREQEEVLQLAKTFNDSVACNDQAFNDCATVITLAESIVSNVQALASSIGTDDDGDGIDDRGVVFLMSCQYLNGLYVEM